MKASCTLQAACELLTDGTHYTPADVGIGVPFLTVKDVSPNGLDLKGCSKISYEDYLIAKKGKSVPQIGDILFSKDGTVGKVHLVREHEEFAVLSSLAILRPKPDLLDGGFLSHFLRSPQTVEAAGRKKTGSAIRRVVLRDLGDLIVPTPPLDEQRRIAAILDQAGALQRDCAAASECLDRLTDVLFVQAFGDPKLHSERWPALSFDEACRDETSRSARVQRGDYLPSGSYPVVDQGQLQIAGWASERDFLCKSALPVVVFGDHTRVVKFVDFPFVVGADGAKVLKPSLHYSPVFFAHLLKRMPIPALGYSRHMRELKRMTFPCPPRALQDRFAAQVSEIEASRERMKRRADKLDALFTSLQHRAFRGEL